MHGTGGDRKHYKPINSVICRSSDPVEVVGSILEFHPFDIFYIADLDALQNIGCASSIVDSLHTRFSNTEFWIDGGISSPADLARYPTSDRITPIIASECMTDIPRYKSLVNHLTTNGYLLSLDHKNGRLGAADLFHDSTLWPKNVIIMDLDSVGKSSGPNLDLMHLYQSKSPSTNFFGAGGVRDMKDIELLMSVSASGTLVASALHNGQISKEDLHSIRTKKNAPHSEAF